MLTSVENGVAQGVARSNGIGIRAGFWKMGDSSSFIKLDDNTLAISGTGVWFNFYSRLLDEWLLEFHLGMTANIVSKEFLIQGELSEDDDFTMIIPFLFGLRYDILAYRNPSRIQPYFSLGGGPYWITSVNPVPNSVSGNVDSGAVLGGYLGGGFNVGILSWFGFNFDLRYNLVDFNTDHEYSGVQFSAGVDFMWGSKRNIVNVGEVRMLVTDIYPAYYQFYNYYPLAIVTIQNMTRNPVEVNIRSVVNPYSDRPRDTGFIQLGAKETRDIPVNAIFGPQIRNVELRETATLDLQIEARSATNYVTNLSNPLMVHNRNSWNGEMDKLVWFVTPDEERVLALSRKLVSDLEFQNGAEVKNLAVARHIFNELSESGLHYQQDPTIPFYKDDRVQYANETLELRAGDCDDLVVLYASILESVGINTAFVEVMNSDAEEAHLYLIFNSGLQADEAPLISSNDKRYLLRENSLGQLTAWVPVETTLFKEGFEAAWEKGALQYLREVTLEGGQIAGWVRIIDVE
jgi:hypothetical protein